MVLDKNDDAGQFPTLECQERKKAERSNTVLNWLVTDGQERIRRREQEMEEWKCADGNLPLELGQRRTERGLTLVASE